MKSKRQLIRDMIDENNGNLSSIRLKFYYYWANPEIRNIFNDIAEFLRAKLKV